MEQDKNDKLIMKTEENTRIAELLKEQIKDSEYQVVAAKFNNEYKSLDFALEESGKIELIDISSKEGMKINVNTLIFIMGKAFWHTFPKARVSVNYDLKNSVYCTLDNIEVTEKVLEKVSLKMQEIIKNDLKIEKREMTRKEAGEFYSKNNTLKGKLQLDLKENDKIYMYYCEDYYNYIYDIISTHTGATSKFELQKYNKGFVLKYPEIENLDVIPPIEENDTIELINKEYEESKKILGINNVSKLNNLVKENKIKELITLSEALQNKKISKIADEILERKNIKMILIAGPALAGKIVFAKKLELQLKLNGLKGITISINDNFENEEKNDRLTENQKYKIYVDSFTTIQFDLFNKISIQDVKLIKQIIRESKIGKHTVQETISMWKDTNNEIQNNFNKCKKEADYIFNSSLIYELGAIKEDVIKLLKKVSNEEKEYAEAQRLIEMLKYFETIPEELVPEDSIIKE